MNESLVRVEILRPGVAVVVLNRPEKRNALNIPVLDALCNAVTELSGRSDVRAIILRGEGPSFCAGLDLLEAQDPEKAHESAEGVARLLRTLVDSPKVTIAAVHGAAVAGGAGLMMACDLVVASGDLRTGFPEVRRGLVAGMVMTLLRRQVSERHARELLLTGELVDAERAFELGLINRVVTPEKLMAAAELYAVAVSKGGPEALARTKALFHSLWPRPFDDDLDRALALHKEVRVSDEAMEGTRAFAEKRLPNWATED